MIYILSLFLTLNLFSQTHSVKDTYMLDLSPASTRELGDIISCSYDQGGEKAVCTKYEKRCEYSSIHPKSLSDIFIKEAEGSDILFFRYENEKSIERVRSNEKGHYFQIGTPTSIEIYKVSPSGLLSVSSSSAEVKEPNSRIENLKPESLNLTINFELPYKNEEIKDITFLLFDQEIYIDAKTKKITLNLSKGHYQVGFRIEDTSNVTKQFQIEISKDDFKEKFRLEKILPGHLEKVRSSTTHVSHHDSPYSSGDIQISTGHDSLFIYNDKQGVDFSEIESLQIAGREELDLKGKATIKNGSILFASEIAFKIKQMIQSYYPVRFRFQGKCKIDHQTRIGPKFEIFEKPEKSSRKLGSLVSTYLPGPDSDVKVFFVDNEDNSEPWEPNYFADKCEPQQRELLVLHQIKEFKNQWSNLGKGPWGENGWIEQKSKNVADLGLSFGGDSEGRGSLEIRNGKYVIEKSDEKGKVQRTYHEDELFNQDGTFHIGPDCEVGC